MQTFLLGQAVIEHSALSSISSGISGGIGDARYQLGVFIENMDATRVFIGLAIVVLLMLRWRK